MQKSLYDVIEDFDTLRLELLYYLKSNESYIKVEVGESYSEKSDFLQILGGLEFTNEKLIERFKTVSDELTEIMKVQKNDTH
ncbi:MAG: Unknown protein [uncultured Sulfurovum sp.]|uniref:Uncharacterized protein n=1 Tax=uncultured Sulfurovum sp. TaxID=269237 RepID=A0A6S6SC63_9BACT|nr:MAG: Unknown protein [uncultured Sulfurovum sp.]